VFYSLCIPQILNAGNSILVHSCSWKVQPLKIQKTQWMKCVLCIINAQSLVQKNNACKPGFGIRKKFLSGIFLTPIGHAESVSP